MYLMQHRTYHVTARRKALLADIFLFKLILLSFGSLFVL
jgi:hypothetical protein